MKVGKGVKKQVLGSVLIALGVITALLSRLIGFELDVFYPIISAVGAGLVIVGTLQRKTLPQEQKQGEETRKA